MSNPHFNVINSNSLETLAKICAQLMDRYPLADPLLNEEIVVMNMGMRSFLTQEIAKQNQIAAQCNFQQIWQLIWNIHNKVNGSDDKLNRFDRSSSSHNKAVLMSCPSSASYSSLFFERGNFTTNSKSDRDTNISFFSPFIR